MRTTVWLTGCCQHHFIRSIIAMYPEEFVIVLLLPIGRVGVQPFQDQPVGFASSSWAVDHVN